jgi:hypothetical protein
MTIDDFDLGEYAGVPIKRIYDNHWIILAQSEQDYDNKVRKINRGDRLGFLTIETNKIKIV